ncbi:MAG: response regulator [Desulfobacula sp.]|nr:response regulator [Desulfobacula sp.]
MQDLDTQDTQEKGIIMLVDDMPQNLITLESLLKKKGYQVRPALSGKQALKALSGFLPDLILLDVRMPEMNGFEVCEKIKSDPATNQIPVIFISALDAVEDKIRGFEAGGVDYITKPFQSEEVLARIGTHLKLKKALEEIKVLKGILPICSHCKKIRDDKGDWNNLESYIQKHSDASFSHGICPECSEEFYGNEDWYDSMKKEK